MSQDCKFIFLRSRDNVLIMTLTIVTLDFKKSHGKIHHL